MNKHPCSIHRANLFERRKMKTEVLLEIVKTRAISLDNNPTKKSLIKEIIGALERLIKYEHKDNG